MLRTHRALATVCSLLLALASLPAATPAQAADDASARTWFTEQYRRLGIEVAPADLGRLAEAWGRTTLPGAPADARREALTELLQVMIEVQEASDTYPQGPPASWLSRVDELQGLAAPPDPLPGPPSDAPLGRVAESGTGALPVVLLAGEVPAEVAFGELLALHGDGLRALTVELPGFGGTPPLPLPRDRDYGARPWLGTVTRGVLEEVRSRGLDRPVVVGHGLGGYVALELARRHPEAFRAAVVVDPTRPLTLEVMATRSIALFTASGEGRRTILHHSLPPIFPAGPEEGRLGRSGLARAVPFLAHDPETSSRVADALARVHPTVLSRFLREALTMDRRAALEGVRVPTLLLFPFHDQSSALWNLSFIGAGFWKQAVLDSAGAPVQDVTFRDVRDPFLDRPLELGRAVADFVARRPVADLPGDPLLASNQVSTSRSVSAVLGVTEVEIHYGSPRVRGRELWGALVPWDQPWRAGANEATRLSVSRPVEIGGERLEAGEYSLLVHPREEGTWTLILNRVPWIWATFGYDPAYNALTLELKPETGTSWTEALTYQLEETSAAQGALSLAWGDVRLRAGILALGGGLELVRPVDPERLAGLGGWMELSTDPAGDAANQPVLHDGTALAAAYECSTERVWFRFDLAGPPHASNIGLNVAVDTDRDLSTGMAWWASNRQATFDRLVTLWAEGSDESGYVGTVGISEAADVGAQDYAALLAGGLDLGIDRDRDRLYLGVPADLLDDDGELALVATVGTNLFWNDDLVDEGQRPLSVPELRHRSCDG